MSRAWGVVAVVVGLASGCASSSAVRAARTGDFASLKRQIDARSRQGKLTNGEAADIARAVAGREIASARSPADASARVRDVRACARELDSELAARMDTHDEAGAEAALARLDMGKLDAGSVRKWVNERDDAWRAVGARGLVRTDDDRVARQRALVDPSPRVRRAVDTARLALDGSREAAAGSSGATSGAAPAERPEDDPIRLRGAR